MKVTIWDPRKKENYFLKDFQTKKTFSSLSCGLFVVEMQDINWDTSQCNLLLYKIFAGIKVKNIMVVIMPWRKEREFKRVLNGFLKVDYKSSNYISVYDNNLKIIKKIFNARKELGAGDSGEWMFLASNNPLLKTRFQSGTAFSKALEDAKDIEFLMFMAEMGQTFLMFKEFPGIDSLIDNISSLEMK
ncbi:MAG: hypothetical protein K0U59_00710 [Gammaproteobacteria bacterium]|nr:hypothetical protein [Gammaproteobacteria bacterium]